MSDLDKTFVRRIQEVIMNYSGKPSKGHIEVVEFESERDLNRKDRRLIAELRESHK